MRPGRHVGLDPIEDNHRLLAFEPDSLDTPAWRFFRQIVPVIGCNFAHSDPFISSRFGLGERQHRCALRVREHVGELPPTEQPRAFDQGIPVMHVGHQKGYGGMRLRLLSQPYQPSAVNSSATVSDGPKSTR
jgi:hypothetical protein